MTDGQDNVLGPMAHLESWSNTKIIIFTCAHFTLNSEWQKAHKNFLQQSFCMRTLNSAQVPQINPTAVGLKMVNLSLKLTNLPCLLLLLQLLFAMRLSLFSLLAAIVEMIAFVVCF